jgi:hypothetical protein
MEIEVFVRSEHIQPSLVFAGKARSTPYHLSDSLVGFKTRMRLDKHSSLYCPAVSDEERQIDEVDTKLK